MKVDIFKEFLSYITEVHNLGEKCKTTNQSLVQPYSYVKVYYFDANTTSVVQPMD